MWGFVVVDALFYIGVLYRGYAGGMSGVPYKGYIKGGIGAIYMGI